MPRLLRIGTRASALALRQTLGDPVRGPLTQAPTVGVFVRELESALLDGSIDMAVHSLKDLPTELPQGLALAACPSRADPRDVLVTRHRCPLVKLPRRARLGTGSPRRVSQLKAY